MVGLHFCKGAQVMQEDLDVQGEPTGAAEPCKWDDRISWVVVHLKPAWERLSRGLIAFPGFIIESLERVVL